MWSLTDKFWDLVETLAAVDELRGLIALVPKLLLKLQPPQNESDYILFLIRKIRDDAYIYRLFQELLYGRHDRLPFIASVWRLGGEKRLLYIGGKAEPTQEEKRESRALNWLISKNIAEAAQISIYNKYRHEYFISPFGNKVKEKYEELYLPDRRISQH